MRTLFSTTPGGAVNSPSLINPNDDPPNRQLAFVGQEWNAKFGVAALVLKGPLANTYLGTVEWGYKVDAAGTATTDPAAVRVVSMGTPSAEAPPIAVSW